MGSLGNAVSYHGANLTVPDDLGSLVAPTDLSHGIRRENGSAPP